MRQNEYLWSKGLIKNMTILSAYIRSQHIEKKIIFMFGRLDNLKIIRKGENIYLLTWAALAGLVSAIVIMMIIKGTILRVSILREVWFKS